MFQIRSKAVNEAFVRLFESGIIYRGKSLVNWSCTLESAISDIEVENIELKGPTKIKVPGYERVIQFGQITDIVYKVIDSNDEIIVSTTRPETLLGDVAIAVNPNDPRYSAYRNKFVWHPFRKCEIPIVFDDTVDSEFGSGAVKITPAHDKNDFELAKRHGLPHVPVFDNKGCILIEFGDFGGLPRFDARYKMLNVLAEMNLLRETRPHSMVLPVCSRSRDIIEFLLRDQWFVDCSEMSKTALKYIESGKLNIFPESKVKEYERWMTDTRDWCISRQLWWGHRIPAYEVDFGDEKVWIAARSENELNEKIIKAGRSAVRTVRDPDVLDTWFSSALLPLSAFGWPDKSLEYTKYFPLSLMETGHDILFFWVARMIMLSSVLTQNLPFDKVLLHGIICDSNGRKMSKSLGNVIVPDQVIHGATLDSLIQMTNNNFNSGILSKEEYEKSILTLKKSFPNGIPECGVDALRFTLCSSNIQNHFINFDVTECHTNKLFFNKIWQATKYFLNSYNKHGSTDVSSTSIEKLPKMDQWILSRLAKTFSTSESAINNFNLHFATKSLKNFFYYNFCDIYLETTKSSINSTESTNQARIHNEVLAQCLQNGLTIMSHFTPFLSNALLPHITCHVKQKNFDLDSYYNHSLEIEIEKILEISSTIRQLKSQHSITRKMVPNVKICPGSSEIKDLIGEYYSTIKTLSMSDHMEIIDNAESFSNFEFVAQTTSSDLCSIGILASIDSLKIKPNVNVKKIEKLENDLRKLLERVSNPGYNESASEVVKEKHNEKV